MKELGLPSFRSLLQLSGNLLRTSHVTYFCLWERTLLFHADEKASRKCTRVDIVECRDKANFKDKT